MPRSSSLSLTMIGGATRTTRSPRGPEQHTLVERGLRIAKRMATGTVELNGSPAGFHAPMGGVKLSGLGREYGPEGFDAFVEIKSIGVPQCLADALERPS